MPLATLKVPAKDFINMEAQNRDEVLLGICNKALDKTLQDLCIPDPEDREVRVQAVEDLDRPEFRISFTVGDNEYPDHPEKKSFRPTNELIRKVAERIHNENSGHLQIGKTTLEAWSNTTFRIYEPDEMRDEAVETKDEDVGPPSIEGTKLSIVLSPAMREGVSLFTERDLGMEANSYEELSREINGKLAEILYIPEGDNRMSTEVIFVQEADVGVSVEFDIKTSESGIVSERIRETAANRILNILERNNLVSKEAEVWIRQGEPHREEVAT